MNHLEQLGCIEGFWNQVLFTHLLLLQRLKIIRAPLTLIADYKEEPCKKDETDPYCFGTKERKTMHKILTFSIYANGLHQIIADFKIFKRQNKLPLFETVLNRLEAHGFLIIYVLLDQGFYRKRLLRMLHKRQFTVILPGRSNAQMRAMIEKYVKGQGTL